MRPSMVPFCSACTSGGIVAEDLRLGVGLDDVLDELEARRPDRGTELEVLEVLDGGGFEDASLSVIADSDWLASK